ncbi:synaptophysin-like protein 1 isoform X2 [Homarus americanus]|uniref:synaptophysin-like protein 1 isoform X2 n=1 Tax=Homarus americanus TaxID=6706 RepID=UPI001C44C742|nr:synaptophysin-like protein 1 isoform X2 [Homarus americanus]
MEPMPMQYDQQPPPVYMEQPKIPLQGIFTHLNLRVLKEPRAFIKIFQFIFGICAFATTTDFRTSFSFFVECNKGDNVTITHDITYPFELDAINTKVTYCENKEDNLHLNGDFSSIAEFFVAVGVLAFLYTLAALFLYTFCSSLYDNDDRVPIIDCAIHGVFVILWLAASSALADVNTDIKSVSEVHKIIDLNPEICNSDNCTALKEPNYAKVLISVLLGFLNTFLWGSNLWFLYKETRYFKGKSIPANGSANIAGTA